MEEWFDWRIEVRWDPKIEARRIGDWRIDLASSCRPRSLANLESWRLGRLAGFESWRSEVKGLIGGLED